MEKSIINRRGEYLVVVDVAGTPRDKYSHPAGTWECAMTLADGSPQIIRGAYADGPVMQSIRPDEQAQWAVVGSVSDDKFINILKLLATSKTNAAAALGSIKSAKKAASSRENGRLGGRPAGKKVLIRNQFHNTEKVFSIKSSYFGNDPDFDALTALEYQIYSGGDDIEYAKKKQAEIKKALCGQSDCRCGCKIVKIL